MIFYNRLGFPESLYVNVQTHCVVFADFAQSVNSGTENCLIAIATAHRPESVVSRPANLGPQTTFQRFIVAPHSPQQRRGPRLDLRMKSLSLDSPDVMGPTATARPGQFGSGLQLSNTMMGGAARPLRHQHSSTALRTRAAANSLTRNGRVVRLRPDSVEMAAVNSAPASHMHCTRQKKKERVFWMWCK